MQQDLLRLPAVLARVGLGRSTVYARIKSREFPSPIRLGPRSVAWLSSEVDDFIAQRIAESRVAPNAGPRAEVQAMSPAPRGIGPSVVRGGG
jgi:prophage regulatory protein